MLFVVGVRYLIQNVVLGRKDMRLVVVRRNVEIERNRKENVERKVPVICSQRGCRTYIVDLFRILDNRESDF